MTYSRRIILTEWNRPQRRGNEKMNRLKFSPHKSLSTKADLSVRLWKVLGPWLLIIPSAILLYFFVWRPIMVGFYYSLFDLKGYTPVKFAGLKNYIHVLTDAQFLQVLFNTFKYVAWSMVIGFFLPLILAIMLNEMIHMRNTFRIIVYFPVMIPAIACSIIWYYIYYPDASGLLNMLLSLFGKETGTWLQNPNLTIPLIVISMTWKGCGSTTILYLASLQGINRELYEAAVIDGASFFSRVRRIAVPQVRGMMLLMFVQQIIGVFQVMEQPLAMTDGGPNGASMSLSLQGYKYAFVYNQPDNALALGVCTFAILMVLTIVYFKLDKKLS